MIAAIEATPGSVSQKLFRRGATAALKSLAKAPVEFVDTISKGTLKRLLTGSSEDDVIVEVDDAIERQLKAQDSFIARATKAIEIQLTAETNPYMENLVTTFEAMWRQQQNTQ